MKKLIAILIALAVCCAMVLPVAAEEFVPSISYKDYPDVVGDPEIKDDAGKVVTDATLVITPVADALDTPENERNEIEDTLIDIYEQLDNGDMKLPVSGDDDNYYIIRDLVDLSVVDNEGNEIADVGTVEVTFDLDLDEDDEIVVMVYTDGEWHVVDDVDYNGNGSITVTFDKLGPVAFCVEEQGQIAPTGDRMTHEVIIWGVLMVVSACAAVVMLISRRKVRY